MEFITCEPIHLIAWPADPVFEPVVEDVFVFSEVSSRKEALPRFNNPYAVADA